MWEAEGASGVGWVREREKYHETKMEATSINHTQGVNITGRYFVADLMVGRPASKHLIEKCLAEFRSGKNSFTGGTRSASPNTTGNGTKQSLKE